MDDHSNSSSLLSSELISFIRFIIEFFDDCDYLDLLEDFEIEDLESDKYCKNSRDSNPLMKLPNPFPENDLNELALLGFFNDFTLVDVGLHDFIREVYFEE